MKILRARFCVPVFISEFPENSSLLFDIKCCLIQPVTILFLAMCVCFVYINTHSYTQYTHIKLSHSLVWIWWKYCIDIQGFTWCVCVFFSRIFRVHSFFIHASQFAFCDSNLTFTSCTRLLYACLHCHHLSAIDDESFSLRIHSNFVFSEVTLLANITWKWESNRMKRRKKKTGINDEFFFRRMPILFCNLTRYTQKKRIIKSMTKTDRVCDRKKSCFYAWFVCIIFPNFFFFGHTHRLAQRTLYHQRLVHCNGKTRSLWFSFAKSNVAEYFSIGYVKCECRGEEEKKTRIR